MNNEDLHQECVGQRKEERERETSNIVKISRVFGWRKSKKGAS